MYPPFRWRWLSFRSLICIYLSLSLFLSVFSLSLSLSFSRGRPCPFLSSLFHRSFLSCTIWWDPSRSTPADLERVGGVRQRNRETETEGRNTRIARSLASLSTWICTRTVDRYLNGVLLFVSAFSQQLRLRVRPDSENKNERGQETFLRYFNKHRKKKKKKDTSIQKKKKKRKEKRRVVMLPLLTLLPRSAHPLSVGGVGEMSQVVADRQSWVWCVSSR